MNGGTVYTNQAETATHQYTVPSGLNQNGGTIAVDKKGDNQVPYADTYSFAQRKNYLAQPDGWSREMWAKFAELGLLGLPFAEQYGGFGGGAQEVMLVMQAFGRVLVLEPFLPTVVLCGTAINAVITDARLRPKRWLRLPTVSPPTIAAIL